MIHILPAVHCIEPRRISFNLGYFEKADQYFERFTAIAKDDFGINFHDIENSSQWRLSRTEIENEKYPSWMGTSILYAGLIKKRNGAPLATQEALFLAAIETMQAEIDIGSQFAQEPAHFIGRAKQELGPVDIHRDAINAAARFQLAV